MEWHSKPLAGRLNGAEGREPQTRFGREFAADGELHHQL